jgi:hypothetical protein
MLDRFLGCPSPEEVAFLLEDFLPAAADVGDVLDASPRGSFAIGGVVKKSLCLWAKSLILATKSELSRGFCNLQGRDFGVKSLSKTFKIKLSTGTEDLVHLLLAPLKGTNVGLAPHSKFFFAALVNHFMSTIPSFTSEMQSARPINISPSDSFSPTRTK